MKIKIFIMIMVVLVSLTGCKQSEVYTEDELDILAEYMAGAILRYDKYYEGGLVQVGLDSKTLENNQEPEEVVKPDVPDVPVDKDEPLEKDESLEHLGSLNLTQLIGKGNFEFKYSKYKTHEYYPEENINSYFSLTARDGYELVVLSFKGTNMEKKDSVLNLTTSNIFYKLGFGEDEYKPLLTLLENDLQYFNSEIKAGSSKELVLIFELLEGTELNNAQLKVSKDKDLVIINMK